MIQSLTSVQISSSGKISSVPSVNVGDRHIITNGKWLKIASIHDDDWLEGEPVSDPQSFVAALAARGLKADLFTFTRKLPDIEKHFDYPAEMESWAAASTTSYAKWWDGLPQESRKNVRRAAKREVVTRTEVFDDALIAGIQKLYNESPLRQGRRFWHYGKDLAAVRRENSSFNDRSEFVCAYLKDELIGFIKMVYVGPVANIMQILCMNSHHDKRTTNAVLAKAVEVCEQKGKQYLIYGRLIYGKNHLSPMVEFKRRNGFDEMLRPRYFIPLTALGHVAFRCGFHQSLRDRLPASVVAKLTGWRGRLYDTGLGRRVLAG